MQQLNVIAINPEDGQVLTQVLAELNNLKKMLGDTQAEIKQLRKEKEPDPPLGAKEVAQLCGLSYNYFINHTRYIKGFPKPIKGTEGKNKRPKWHRQDIIEFREANSGLLNE